jgi:hypothetical protein
MNWFGLSGGITIIFLIAVSLFVPWWQLTAGDNIVKANTSPINTNFDFLGNSFTIPLIWAFNISSIILLVAGGIAILIYSINPTKPYAKQLLGFAYRKPLYALVFFVVGLIAVILVMKLVSGLDIPLTGSTVSTLSGGLTEGATQGVTISVLLKGEFVWPFGLAIASAVLCIAARLYHKN